MAGPGGVFGNGLYAISRGGGGNPNAVNRPGVIYRVDPATGKASVFFDLNTVMNQLDPNSLNTDGKNPAANSLGASTGYVNWYDIAFDPEGYFDGSPSMFVSSADRSDPAKNAIYQISPERHSSWGCSYADRRSGGYQVQHQSHGHGDARSRGPGVPPRPDRRERRPRRQGGTFAALFFNSNAYSPGQVISNGTLPKGVSQTGMTLGTIAGMTAANIDYLSPVYSVFTDFGTPPPADPRAARRQRRAGLNGELLIGQLASRPRRASLTLDQTGAVSSRASAGSRTSPSTSTATSRRASD